MGLYHRRQAVDYALRYGLYPNDQYIYFEGNDCTNFISQCLRSGGAKNHFHPTHPWWYIDGDMSLSWSVAGSLYWYIRVSTEDNAEGIKARTFFQSTGEPLRAAIRSVMEIGDLIQYRDQAGVRHSSIITAFEQMPGGLEPLITQHTSNQVNIPWRKTFPTAVFHHIVDVS